MTALTGVSATGSVGIITILEPYVPTVKKLPTSVAVVQLNTLGFNVVENYEANAAASGTVVGQSPAAGQQASQGSTVTLTVSTGPASPNTGPTARAASQPNLPNKILDQSQPITDASGRITSPWWRLILNISNQTFGTNANQETTISVTGSPFVYTPIVAGSVIVSGGAVSLVEYSPTGKTFYPAGVMGGVFQMIASSSLRVTFSSPPALTFFPR